MIVVDSFLLHWECTGGGTKQIEYYQALLLALIDNHYEIGVVLQRLAENREEMHQDGQGWRGHQGRACWQCGWSDEDLTPYYTNQTSDRTGWHRKKELFAVPVQTLWLEDHVCV
jgi:hypothetical protein